MAKITSIKTSADNNKLFTAQVNDDNTREFKEYNISSGINNKNLLETADVTSFDEGMDVITVNPSGDKFIGVDRRGREVVNLGTGNNFSVNSFNLLSTFKVDRLVRGDVYENVPAELADFNPGPNGGVVSITELSDGNYLVGGVFTSIGGVSRDRIAILRPDGSVTDFNPGANNYVYGVTELSDGNYLVGGFFTTIGGVSRDRIAILRPDGSVTDFNPGANNHVYGVTELSDGNYLVGGFFTTIGGVSRDRIAILRPDGGNNFITQTEIPFITLSSDTTRLLKVTTTVPTSGSDINSITISDGTNNVTILPSQVNTEVNIDVLVGRNLTITFNLTGNKDINTILNEYSIGVNK